MPIQSIGGNRNTPATRDAAPHLLVEPATRLSARALRFVRRSTMISLERGGQSFLEFCKGGRVMKHAVGLLGIVFLLIFAACGNGEKAEQPAKSEYQGAVEGVKEEAHGVTQTMEEEAEEAVEGVKEEAHGVTQTMEEKAGEAVETLKAKTGEAVETAKEKAAEPFQGMAEKMGGHTEAAKEALE